MAEGYGYGKKPWWFWLVLYLIIGGLVYYAIYYFAYGRNGGYGSQNPGSTQKQNSPYSY